jgi:hypothetical protein
MALNLHRILVHQCRRATVAGQQRECCNPLAKRNEDRCIGCPMRDSEASQSKRGTGVATKDGASPGTPEQPVTRPAPSKSLWAFLNGEIPRQ